MMSPMKDTAIRNPEQLGRIIRLKRLEKALSQAALAQQLGVERKWVIRLEAGNPKAEMGLVLRAFAILGLRVTTNDDSRPDPAKERRIPRSRLDEVFRQLQRPERK